MGEIKTPPVRINDMACFHDDHTLADIVRWLMQNRFEAEEVHRMLGEELHTAPQSAKSDPAKGKAPETP